MIDLDIEVVIYALKIINLNAEIKIFSIKTMASLIFEINNNKMHTKIVLIEQNIIILF